MIEYDYRERMVVVSFKAPKELDEYLERIAWKMKLSKSELIRRALYYYLNNSQLLARISPVETKRIRIW